VRAELIELPGFVLFARSGYNFGDDASIGFVTVISDIDLTLSFATAGESNAAAAKNDADEPKSKIALRIRPSFEDLRILTPTNPEPAARWSFVLNCYLLYFFGVTVWVKGLGATTFGPPLAVAAAAPPDAALPQMPPPWQSTSPWFFKSS
jgi:hypothetical protein